MRHRVIPILDSGGQLSTDAQNLFVTDLTEPPCVFVGSGISIWPPSDLPSGQTFTNTMFSLLFERLDFRPGEKDLLAQIFGLQYSSRFSGMPFEHLMECCPFQDKANALINLLYDSTRFNELHRALAQRVKEGRIHSIITTNYDCCLDKALQEEDFPFAKVVTDSHAGNFLNGESLPCYFKIHGSIEKGLEHSPMYSLKHEGLLQPDKRKLLTKLITGRSLVMIGYSGLDFELCPEIERLKFKRLIWNNRKDNYPSISAQRLIENTEGILLHGDMRQLFKYWLGCRDTELPNDLPKLTQEQSEALHEVVRKLVQKIFSDEEELRLWAIRVLNSLGAPTPAIRMLSGLSSSRDRFFVRIENGRAEFHSGRYKKARRSYQRALVSELIAGNRIRAADSALELSDAYRTFGAPFRGYVCTWFVNLLFLKSLKAKKLLKQSLVIKNLLEISSSAKESIAGKIGRRLPAVGRLWGSVNAWLETRLVKKIIDCGRESQATGNWIDFQQLALIAEEINIDIKELAVGNYYLPPPATEGYRHLGYYIPQTMVFFTNCRKDNSLLRTSSGRTEWKHHVKTCKRLGVNSSLWKILALSQSSKTKKIARHTFEGCEYSFLKGLFDWKKFSGEWSFPRPFVFRRK